MSCLPPTPEHYQPYTSPEVKALACGLSATNGFRTPTEEELEAVCDEARDATASISFIRKMLSGVMVDVPMVDEDGEDCFVMKAPEDVLEEEELNALRNLLDGATEDFEKYLNGLIPDWCVGKNLYQPLPLRLRKLLRAVVRAGFGPKASAHEIEEMVESLTEGFRTMSAINWVLAGNAVIEVDVRRHIINFLSIESLSIKDRVRYRQIRRDAGLIPSVSEADAVKAKKLGQVPAYVR